MKSLCGLGERHKIYKQEPFFVLNKTNSVDAARWALNVTNLQFAKHLNGKGKWVALQARHTIYKMQYYPNLSSVAQYGTLTLPPSSMNLRNIKVRRESHHQELEQWLCYHPQWLELAATLHLPQDAKAQGLLQHLTCIPSYSFTLHPRPSPYAIHITELFLCHS